MLSLMPTGSQCCQSTFTNHPRFVKQKPRKIQIKKRLKKTNLPCSVVSLRQLSYFSFLFQFLLTMFSTATCCLIVVKQHSTCSIRQCCFDFVACVDGALDSMYMTLQIATSRRASMSMCEMWKLTVDYIIKSLLIHTRRLL